VVSQVTKLNLWCELIASILLVRAILKPNRNFDSPESPDLTFFQSRRFVQTNIRSISSCFHIKGKIYMTLNRFRIPNSPTKMCWQSTRRSLNTWNPSLRQDRKTCCHSFPPKLVQHQEPHLLFKTHLRALWPGHIARDANTWITLVSQRKSHSW